jgi:restriction system protein
MSIPNYYKLFNPLIAALHALGGSGTVAETEEKVAEIMGFSDEEINEIHDGNRTVLSYRLAWARTYLKMYGILENSTRGIWALTPKGREVTEVDEDDVIQLVRSRRGHRRPDSVEEEVEEGREPEEGEQLWQEVMLDQLRALQPDAFERLCQRFLRESGFVQVEVTGRSGDGGIDGRGVIKVAGLLSFPIIFQCKRYSGSVSSSQIRDFRGAMTGRTDKGLVITTGTFTKDAKQEAVREGAPQIDLIDGTELVEKMKELGLGVRIKTEETIEIDPGWFKSF